MCIEQCRSFEPSLGDRDFGCAGLSCTKDDVSDSTKTDNTETEGPETTNNRTNTSWVSRGRKLLLASATLATLTGATTGFVQPAAAELSDFEGGFNSDGSANTSSSSDTSSTSDTSSSSSNTSEVSWTETRTPAATPSSSTRTGDSATSGTGTSSTSTGTRSTGTGSGSTTSYDAFGNSYQTPQEAQSADVVSLVQSSVANIEVTGGRPTDYDVTGAPGVHRHNGSVVVLGNKTGEETISVSGSQVSIGKTRFDLDFDADSEDLTIFGNGGSDKIIGSDFDDTIVGGEGRDHLLGGNGNDKLFGGGGADSLAGNQGNDRLFGGDGKDVLDGNLGNDYLAGGDGNDTLYGSAGIDRLFGGVGRDYLEGGRGNDYLSGGDGRDLLSGGWGHDDLDGGNGVDTYVGGLGRDRILDSDGEQDRIYADKADLLGQSRGNLLAMLESDPSLGRNVRILGGDPQFTDNAEADLALLRSIPSGQQLLASIDGAGHEVLLTQNRDPRSEGSATPLGATLEDRHRQENGQPGTGTDSHITYQGTPSTPDDLLPSTRDANEPVSILGHELAHADHNARGVNIHEESSIEALPNGSARRLENGAFALTSDEELKTVGLPYGHDTETENIGRSLPHPNDVAENDIRHDLGLTTRTQYVTIPSAPQQFLAGSTGSSIVTGDGSPVGLVDQRPVSIDMTGPADPFGNEENVPPANRDQRTSPSNNYSSNYAGTSSPNSLDLEVGGSDSDQRPELSSQSSDDSESSQSTPATDNSEASNKAEIDNQHVGLGADLSRKGTRGPGTHLDYIGGVGTFESVITENGNVESVTFTGANGRTNFNVNEQGEAVDVDYLPAIDDSDSENGGGTQVDWNETVLSSPAKAQTDPQQLQTTKEATESALRTAEGKDVLTNDGNPIQVGGRSNGNGDEQPASHFSHPSSPGCSDSDGDGWGWTGTASCRMP